MSRGRGVDRARPHLVLLDERLDARLVVQRLHARHGHVEPLGDAQANVLAPLVAQRVLGPLALHAHLIGLQPARTGRHHREGSVRRSATRWAVP